MLGRSIRLVAATAALTFAGLSGASAGWYGSGCCGAALPTPVNWGCASSGCAPIAVNWGCGSCAPVRWGCGNSCGFGFGGGYGGGYGYGAGYGGYGYGYGAGYGGYGYGAGYGYANPIHVAYQGPTYDPPQIGYTYPAYGVRRPFVRGFGYRHLGRPFVGSRYGVGSYRRVGVGYGARRVGRWR